MHDFEVRIADPEHPVTSGMKAFRITDELWHRVGVTGKLYVLATAFAAKSKGGTGADEPAALWQGPQLPPHPRP